ncbi:MAG: phosphate signaling complex protein PhoU [Clostridia bacterium]|nr:phosphate signaling complex protein PhoU [Clostridia bacterium]
MRSKFDEQLNKLNRELIEMGALCEQIIAMAAKALSEKNLTAKNDISAIDSEIDQKEHEIEAMCLKMILQQQPVAKDLRQISAALKMITDMERIGDQAYDIAEIISFLKKHPEEECAYISQMAQAAIKMVTESVDAYVRQDLSLAKKIMEYDDVLDDYFVKTRESLIRMIAQNPNSGEYAIDLLMIAKYFERIGDHATNIAEWVEFSLTGIHKGEVEL